ncbi:MAG TPA: SDR family oxidoreductase [Polyangiaceae bacterium]|nr:SDR family oxidoreductase [Polyangiaceae bacterium]
MRRAILITGASRGVGRATAVAFAERGDRVAIHHRDSAEAAQELRLELAGEGHVVVQADLAQPFAIQAMVTEAATALGSLDVVVNNAARSGPHPITDVSYEEWQAEWRQTIDVNLMGAANVIYWAVRHMKRGGRIVNVSSRGAFRGEPQQPAYGASKAGLNALGQSLAVALAPRGIAVATVAPGYVEIDTSNAHLKSPRGPEIRAQSPFNRVARPEEVAAAIVWLSSPEAEWASGAILDLNGASYLRS